MDYSPANYVAVVPTTTTSNPSSEQQRCKHEQFHANVNVHRNVENVWPNLTQYVAQIQIVCAQCGMSFLFPLLGQLTEKTHGVSPDNRVALLHMIPARKDFP